MKQFMIIALAIIMASCCTTKEFVATEIDETIENYEYIKTETPIWYENEKNEFTKKVSAFPGKVIEHGEYHGKRFMTTFGNFISRETEKFCNIGNCK